MPTVARIARVLEERIAVSERLSPWPGPWIVAHRLLALRRRAGPVRRYGGDVGGEPVTVEFAGRTTLLRWILAGMLGSAELDPGVAGGPAGIVAVEIHPWAAARHRRQGWLIVPATVRWQGPPAGIPPPAPRKSLRSDLAKVARAGYVPEIETADAARLRELLEGMARPLVRRRHGRGGQIPAPRLRRALARNGFLLFERCDGARVAGACFAVVRRTLWIAMIGVRDGDAELVSDGALSAVYLHLAQWARENGVERIDAGRTSPLVHDGLARYKAKWGLEPVPDPLSPLLAVRVDPGATSVRRLLERSPVLVLTGTGLERFPA